MSTLGSFESAKSGGSGQASLNPSKLSSKEVILQDSCCRKWPTLFPFLGILWGARQGYVLKKDLDRCVDKKFYERAFAIIKLSDQYQAMNISRDLLSIGGMGTAVGYQILEIPTGMGIIIGLTGVVGYSVFKIIKNNQTKKLLKEILVLKS
ncbi:MAG: hypothetical protein V4487_08815 [Chlamydiota bacterium]